MTKQTMSAQSPAKTSLDRMADLTRRIVAVKKSELPKTKKRKRQ